MTQAPRPERVKVLVVAHSDGWLELFAESHVDAKIVQQIHGETAAGEIMAEEILDGRLPRPYRDLHVPGKCRACELLRPITADQELNRLAALRVLAAVRELARQPRIVGAVA